MSANTYGRQVVIPLTNKSGGSVAAGDVVVIDTTTDESFTTTATGRAELSVGVAQETIASNAIGRVLVSGYAALVNVPASVTRGHYIETHTVVKQATGNSTRRSGSLGQFAKTSTTPSAWIWGQTDQTPTAATAAFVGAFAYHSTTQSFAATTLTTISLNSEAYDTSAFHDNVTNNSRLVAPSTGYYRITGGIWYATTTGTNYILFDKNGAASYIRGGATAQNGGSSGVHLTTVASLTAADYITMVGYHTEAGSTVTGDTGTTPSQQNYLSMELLGA